MVVFIRSTMMWHFQWVPTTYVFIEKKKREKNIGIFLLKKKKTILSEALNTIMGHRSTYKGGNSVKIGFASLLKKSTLDRKNWIPMGTNSFFFVKIPCPTGKQQVTKSYLPYKKFTKCIQLFVSAIPCTYRIFAYSKGLKHHVHPCSLIRALSVSIHNHLVL